MRLVNILASVIYSIVYVFSLVPLRVLYAMSDFYFFIGYYMIGYRRTVIIQNLSRSFPEKKYGEIRQLSKGFTRHLFSLFSEWVKLLSMPRKILNQRITFKNTELLNAHGAQGKSMILAVGHLGNWECLNLLPQYVDYPVYAVYKAQSSALANKLSIRWRTRFGVQLLEQKEAARFMLKNRNEAALYIFVADQAPQKNTNNHYTFLSQPTSAFVGVERLARATGSSVAYVEIGRQKRGFYEISFTEIPKDKPVTATYLEWLEQSIRKYPETWLWSHKRWKHEVPPAADKDA